MTSFLMTMAMTCVLHGHCHITTLRKEYWIVQIDQSMTKYGRKWGFGGQSGVNRSEYGCRIIEDEKNNFKLILRVGEYHSA